MPHFIAKPQRKSIDTGSSSTSCIRYSQFRGGCEAVEHTDRQGRQTVPGNIAFRFLGGMKQTGDGR